ncbi:adenylate cyclase type 1-like isoform X3, partial [Lates japonicus]
MYKSFNVFLCIFCAARLYDIDIDDKDLTPTSMFCPCRSVAEATEVNPNMQGLHTGQSPHHQIYAGVPNGDYEEPETVMKATLLQKHEIETFFIVPFPPYRKRRAMRTAPQKLRNRSNTNQANVIQSSPRTRVNRYIGRLIEARQTESDTADLNVLTLMYKCSEREQRYHQVPDEYFTSAVVLSLILAALFGLVYLLIIPQGTVILVLLVFCICFLVACIMYLHITRVQCFPGCLTIQIRTVLCILIVLLIYAVAQACVVGCMPWLWGSANTNSSI